MTFDEWWEKKAPDINRAGFFLGLQLGRILEAWRWRSKWTENVPHIDQPLCLQSKQYNLDQKGVTWVYYSKTDAYKLYKFLKGIFAKDQKDMPPEFNKVVDRMLDEEIAK